MMNKISRLHRSEGMDRVQSARFLPPVRFSARGGVTQAAIRDVLVPRLPNTELDRLLVLHPALAKPLTGPQLARAEVNVDLLWSSLAPIHEGDIVKVVIRHPNVLLENPERVAEVLQFLTGDLGLDGSDLRSLITRFPIVLSYGVQAHLRPHIAYLNSLGEEDVKALINRRPAVLGEGIESVVKFLLLCRLPRKMCALLLRSYPLDYSLTLHAPNSVEAITNGAWGTDQTEESSDTS